MPCEMFGPCERPRTVGAFQRGATVACSHTRQWAHHMSWKHREQEERRGGHEDILF